MFITSTDRWTCPHPTCGDTVGRSSLTAEDVWKRQLRAMQDEHGRRHKTTSA